MKRLVIALGGNAITKGNESIKEQFNNVTQSLEGVVKIIKEGHKIIFTHGNGPTVGEIMLRAEAGEKYEDLPYQPLGISVADSQGELGYIIQNCLHNLLFKNMIRKDVITVLTQVLVAKDDPSFNNPTKPVGHFYSKKEATALAKKKKWVMKEDAGRGYRRYVPSPIPIKTIEAKVIRDLFEKGYIVIAAGGGGIAVIERDDKTLKGIPAVIDKDLASSILAKEIKADTLMILTAIDMVAINFRKINQKFLRRLTLNEAKMYYKKGHFHEGSMGPKIKAAINFLDSGGKKAIIGSIDKAYETFTGKSGTEIIH
jgi:carbamate kinase